MFTIHQNEQILDNRAAHFTNETRGWLQLHRGYVVFTPKRGSWVNLVEGFISKSPRYLLCHVVPVAPKDERRRRWPGQSRRCQPRHRYSHLDLSNWPGS
jgi:hypothetical protein